MYPAVVVDSVTKSFPRRGAIWRRRAGLRALDSVSVQVEAGSVLVLLGCNGSGKTTLLKLISGMLFPDSGQVRVAGCETRGQGNAVRRQVGFAVAHERSFFARLSARENLEYFAALDDLWGAEAQLRIDRLLALVGLDAQDSKLTREFSAGMYQRLAIARSLLKQPAVMLLDEPSRSLDPGAAFEMWRLVRESAKQGSAVLVASHSLDEAVHLANEVVLLNHGMVVRHQRVQPGSALDDLRALYFGCIARPDTEPEYASKVGGR
jgi:ABC-2 type transport system ATP-binding protein